MVADGSLSLTSTQPTELNKEQYYSYAYGHDQNQPDIIATYAVKFHAILNPCDSNKESSLRTCISRSFSSNSHSQKLHLGGLPCLSVAIKQT